MVTVEQHWSWYADEVKLSCQLAEMAFYGARRAQLDAWFGKAIHDKEIDRLHRLLSPARKATGGLAAATGRRRGAKAMSRLAAEAKTALAKLLVDYLHLRLACGVDRTESILAAYRVFFGSIQASPTDSALREVDLELFMTATDLVHGSRLIVQDCAHCGAPNLVFNLGYMGCVACRKETVKTGTLNPAFQRLVRDGAASVPAA